MYLYLYHNEAKDEKYYRDLVGQLIEDIRKSALLMTIENCLLYETSFFSFEIDMVLDFWIKN